MKRDEMQLDGNGRRGPRDLSFSLFSSPLLSCPPIVATAGHSAAQHTAGLAVEVDKNST